MLPSSLSLNSFLLPSLIQGAMTQSAELIEQEDKAKESDRNAFLWATAIAVCAVGLFVFFKMLEKARSEKNEYPKKSKKTDIDDSSQTNKRFLATDSSSYPNHHSSGPIPARSDNSSPPPLRDYTNRYQSSPARKYTSSPLESSDDERDSEESNSLSRTYSLGDNSSGRNSYSDFSQFSTTNIIYNPTRSDNSNGSEDDWSLCGLNESNTYSYNQSTRGDGVVRLFNQMQRLVLPQVLLTGGIYQSGRFIQVKVEDNNGQLSYAITSSNSILT